jgi:hypothetical protein
MELGGGIKRHPEVETLLVTGDNRIEAGRKVLNWVAEGVNSGGCFPLLSNTLDCWTTFYQHVTPGSDCSADRALSIKYSALAERRLQET